MPKRFYLAAMALTLATIACCFQVGTHAAEAFASSPRVIRGFADRAVLQVVGFKEDGEPAAIGTAFKLQASLKKPPTLITNKHICKIALKYKEVAVRSGIVAFIVTVKKLSQKTDLCVLEHSPNPIFDSIPAYKPSKETPAISERVVVYGYPAIGQGLLMESSGTFTKKKTHYTWEELIDADVLYTDTRINPGNSGSPLLNMKNEVMGIIFACDDLGESGMSVPVKDVLDFVNGRIP